MHLGVAVARENTAAAQFSFGRAIRILGIPVRKDRRLFLRIILPRLARHRGFHRALIVRGTLQPRRADAILAYDLAAKPWFR